MLINPGIPISEEAMQVHGITPADLRNKPLFQSVAEEIFTFIGDADLAGYNSNRFDIPMLMEELARVGYNLDLEVRRCIDVQRIFYKMEPRTLRAAYRYYCNEELKDAHDALIDVRATVEVLKGQLIKYDGVDITDEKGNIIPSPVKNDIGTLDAFTNDFRILDATQKLRYGLKGEILFNFGKYNGQLAGKVLYEDQQYYNWMLNKEFSIQVKQIIKKEFREYKKTLS